MNAQELIEELQALVKKHGDLPVSLGVVTREYSASNVGHAEEGPLPNLADRGQNPVERFVIEAKDNLEEAH